MPRAETAHFYAQPNIYSAPLHILGRLYPVPHKHFYALPNVYSTPLRILGLYHSWRRNVGREILSIGACYWVLCSPTSMLDPTITMSAGAKEYRRTAPVIHPVKANTRLCYKDFHCFFLG